MTKEMLKKNYGVDASLVNFKTSGNGHYQYSEKSCNGFYITKEADDYTVVNEETNSVCKWRRDLSGIMN